MAQKRLVNRRKESQLVEKEEQRKDLGFGTRITDGASRLVNADGSFNVRRTHVSFWARADVFHRLTVISWKQFFGVIFVLYFCVNVVFSIIYLLIGIEHLGGVIGQSWNDKFWETFFFSAQTLTTVGYGRVSPIGHFSSAVASVEALVGLLGFALATGLVYGRFSRAVPSIQFSRNSLFSPYLDVNAWMFRMINERPTELIDVRVEVTLSRLETLSNGSRTRRYYGLKLERNQVNFFPLSWTIVHPLNEESPLYGATEESLKESDTELLIFVKATEETFAQQVHVRYSYRFSEIIWGAKFRPMFDSSQTMNLVEVDVQKIHDYELKPLN